MIDPTPTIEDAARRLSGMSTAGWAHLPEATREAWRAEVRRMIDAADIRAVSIALPASKVIEISTPENPETAAKWRDLMRKTEPHAQDCAACAAGEPQMHAYEAPETVAPGAYGIEAVDPSTPGAMVCGTCGRAWAEDITPAGRCPWEDQHADDAQDDAHLAAHGDALIAAYEQAQAALRAHAFPALEMETVTDDGETYEALRCPRCGILVDGPDDLYAVSPSEHWASAEVIDDAAFDYGRVRFGSDPNFDLEETLYYSHGMPGTEGSHAVSLPTTWREEWV